MSGYTKTYQIVVPSRRRLENMPTIRRLLPDALICVDESEADEYAELCEGRLLIHPQMSGLPKIRNWIHANVEADYIAHIDDDFRQVLSQVSVFGNKRKITRAEEISVLIENAGRGNRCTDRERCADANRSWIDGVLLESHYKKGQASSGLDPRVMPVLFLRRRRGDVGLAFGVIMFTTKVAGPIHLPRITRQPRNPSMTPAKPFPYLRMAQRILAEAARELVHTSWPVGRMISGAISR